MTRIYHLGIEETLAVIGGKWKPLLLCHLGNGPQRPGELHRKVDGITQNVDAAATRIGNRRHHHAQGLCAGATQS